MPGFCFYKEFFMAIEDFVRDFNRRLDDAIGRAMEGDVADAVRAAIASAVESTARRFISAVKIIRISDGMTPANPAACRTGT